MNPTNYSDISLAVMSGGAAGRRQLGHAGGFLDQQGFIIESSLGKGSYSKVVKARQKGTEKVFAIKIIDKRKASDRYRTLFLPRELHIILTLRHPNIIRTSQVIERSEPPITYIIQELAGKGDLEQLISLKEYLKDEKPLDLAHRIFRDIADGIAYLHQLKVVHRDIKCENIFLDGDFMAKIGDFGFSRSNMGPSLPLSTTYCGSAAYAAPEIIAHTPYAGPPADIWSVGIVLFIMLTGMMPFDDRNLNLMLKEQKKDNIRFPQNRRISKEAEDLIRRQLNSHPHKRITAKETLAHPWLRQTPLPRRPP